MKLFEHNPRKITKTQFERLEVDLDEFGDLGGIVHDLNSDEVISGNQRCRVIDLDKVTPVILETLPEPNRQGTVARGFIEWHGELFSYRQVRWTRERCIAANIKANLDGGSWDFSELGNLGLDGDTLSAIGFDADLLKGWQQETFALGEMLAAETGRGKFTKNVEPQIDKGPELRQKYGVEVGQIWQLGEHKLYCGPAEQAKIQCKFAIYDPPFDWSWQQQDNALIWVKWDTALLMGLHYCMPLVQRSDFCHWWIWDSGMARFGGRGYKPMSGCAICLLFGNNRNWYEQQALSALDRGDIEHYNFPTQVVHIQDNLTNRTELGYGKPYPLYDYIISLYSTSDDLIGDPFAGSGGFLIACENLGRKWHGSEIEPCNVAIILQRFVDTFGIEPQLC